MARRRSTRGFRALVCARRKRIAKSRGRTMRNKGYRVRIVHNKPHKCWLVLVKR